VTFARVAWLGVGLLACALQLDAQTPRHAPGSRVLLDAHNAYPERGQWQDRIERALGTGLPVAIEQDLYWVVRRGVGHSVVAHDDDALGEAPTFESYFFARVRPLIEQALRENRRETWPVLVLNLDFKDNAPAHLDAVWALLGKYESWLTTATRTASPAQVTPMRVGPLLVLTGADTAQRRRFHDDVPVGAPLRAFGAMEPAPVTGPTRGARLHRAVSMTAQEHMPRPADNFARWVNFPWNVIEEGGQSMAGPFTTPDSARLASFVQRAHAQGYLIRFYTLDGFVTSEDRGWTASYNFGSLTDVIRRWDAAIAAGVDFVATDQYEAFAQRRTRR
jgi:hypothetical protein